MHIIASKDAIVTAVPSVPITAERRPFEDWEKVKHAGIARANIAVTEESPDGAPLPGYTRENANRTVRPLPFPPPLPHLLTPP